MNKKILSETFLNYHFLSEKCLISDKHLINHANNCNKSLSDNIFDYQKDYYKLIDDKQVFWLIEYIRDVFNLYNDLPLIFLKSGVIKLQPNQTLSSHNHLDEYDINNSPDITCLYVVKSKKKDDNNFFKNSYVMIEYEDHRWKQKKYEIAVEPRKFILFNSSLNHSIVNRDDEIILFSFQFQTLGTAK
jgi:hypothetical protein